VRLAILIHAAAGIRTEIKSCPGRIAKIRNDARELAAVVDAETAAVADRRTAA